MLNHNLKLNIELFNEDVEKILGRSTAKRVFVLNKSDKYDESEKRKIISRIKSGKINGFLVSVITGEGLEDLERKMFEEMEVIRIFTKEPGKKETKDPVVLRKGSIVKDVAESILKGFSLRVKETRITGPSAKFPNQKVGLTHELKDLDIVEFHTR